MPPKNPFASIQPISIASTESVCVFAAKSRVWTPTQNGMKRGGEFGFDKLVIATGARARTLSVPGAELEGIHHLRSLDDSRGIRERADSAKCAVMIGGGFIGMKVAGPCLHTDPYRCSASSCPLHPSRWCAHCTNMTGRSLLRLPN